MHQQRGWQLNSQLHRRAQRLLVLVPTCWLRRTPLEGSPGAGARRLCMPCRWCTATLPPEHRMCGLLLGAYLALDCAAVPLPYLSTIRL